MKTAQINLEREQLQFERELHIGAVMERGKDREERKEEREKASKERAEERKAHFETEISKFKEIMAHVRDARKDDKKSKWVLLE